jgi:phospholipid/cholesterol/gamma-HCH transport system substrate-binding protein
LKKKKEVIIGFTILVSIALLIFGINYLKGVNFFNSNRTFYSYYNDVQGLVPGSLVKSKGKQIGVVQDVYFDPETQSRLIAVISISESSLRIPLNSEAKLIPELLGTSFIELILGVDSITNIVSKGPFLVNKDTINPSYKFGMTEMVTQKIEPVEVKVNAILTRIDKLLLGLDKVVGEDGEELASVMNKLKKTLSTLEHTVNGVDSLIASESQTIKSTLRNVESITANLKKSNEKITNLVANFSDLSDTLKNTDIVGTVKEAKEALAGVSTMMDEINNGQGSAHQLIYSDSLINNINGMVQEAQSLVENIKEHPNRYLQFAVFGGKDKGIKLDSREEKELKDLLDKQP